MIRNFTDADRRTWEAAVKAAGGFVRAGMSNHGVPTFMAFRYGDTGRAGMFGIWLPPDIGLLADSPADWRADAATYGFAVPDELSDEEGGR